jgi:hypothetical protein
MSARPAADAYGRHVAAMGDEHAEHHPDGVRAVGDHDGT